MRKPRPRNVTHGTQGQELFRGKAGAHVSWTHECSTSLSLTLCLGECAEVGVLPWAPSLNSLFFERQSRSPEIAEAPAFGYRNNSDITQPRIQLSPPWSPPTQYEAGIPPFPLTRLIVCNLRGPGAPEPADRRGARMRGCGGSPSEA